MIIEVGRWGKIENMANTPTQQYNVYRSEYLLYDEHKDLFHYF